jgi:hypothetical protein
MKSAPVAVRRGPQNFRERRERTEEELLDALDKATRRLIELVDSPERAVALRAVTLLFDRVLGRPRQMLEHSGSLLIQSQMATEAMRARLDSLIERRARSMLENGDGPDS